MSPDVEQAKRSLLEFAARHDAEKAARRKPGKMMLLSAGAGLVAARLLFGGARRRGLGPRVMGLMFIARLAARYGPAVLRAIKDGQHAYRGMGGSTRRATTPRPRPPAPVTVQEVRVLSHETSGVR